MPLRWEMGVRVSVLRRLRSTGHELVSLSVEGLGWRGAGPLPRLTCVKLPLGRSTSGEARFGDKRGRFSSVGGCWNSSLVSPGVGVTSVRTGWASAHDWGA